MGIVMAVVVVALVMATIIEAAWERLQDLIPEKWMYPKIKEWGAVLIAVGLCIYYKIDFVAALLKYLVSAAAEAGVTLTVVISVTIVGMILTGILISRGAGSFHKVLETILAWVNGVRFNNEKITDVYDRGGDGVG